MSLQPPQSYLKVEPYLEVTSSISMLFTFSEGVVRVIGVPGSGKSSVCQMLADELKAEGMQPVFFQDTPGSLEIFDQTLRQTLKLDKTGTITEAFTRHLVNADSVMDGKRTVLIFDDAESIPDDVFQCLNELIDAGSGSSTPCMVFCGTDELKAILDTVSNQSLGHKNIANLKIQPLNREELPAYCQAYMAKVGLDNHDLDDASLDHIFEASGGLPKQVPELIYEQIDRENQSSESDTEDSVEKRRLIALDDDQEPDTRGMSVADREEVLVQFKGQVPWRWQSNGVAVAVVILFMVVAFGWFYPRQDLDIPTVTIYPPPVFDATSLVQVPTPDEGLADTTIPVTPEEDVITQPEPEAENVAEVAVEEDVSELPAGEVDQDAVTDDEELQLADSGLVDEESTIGEEAVPEPEEGVDIGLAEIGQVQQENDTPEDLVGAAQNTEEPETITPEPIQESEPVSEVVELASTTPQQADPVEPISSEAEAEITADTVETSPVVQAVVETETAQPGVSDTAYIDFVNDWLASWEAQNPEAYFEFYLEDFDPGSSTSLSAWRQDRRGKITTPAFISIDADAFQIEQPGDGSVLVRFTMDYDSDDYADRTNKEVTLVTNTAGELGIIRERSLNVDVVRVGPRPQQPQEEIAANNVEDEGLGPDEYESYFVLAGEINEWLSAWQSQNLEQYFNQYHDNFMPASQDTIEDWREERIRNISRPRYIEIEVDDLRVFDSGDQGVLVRFWLSYASSYYKDMTRKEVLLTPVSQGEFSITQERNLQVQVIPYYP